MKSNMIRGLVLVALTVGLAACANPFADAASTKGPGLTAVSSVGRASVSWNAVLGASGYRLEWSTSPDFTGATVVDPATSPVTIEDTVPGTTYHVRALARLKSGSTSWSGVSLSVGGWSWVPPAATPDIQNVTTTKTIVVGGSSIDVSTSYKITTVRYESLRYSSGGLTRSTYLRATTEVTGIVGSTTQETNPVNVTGDWDTGQVWKSLKLGGNPYSITNLSSDRTSFTFDNATWTLTP